MDLRRLDFQKVAAITDRDLLLGKMSLLDHAVRRFDKPEFVDPRERAHRADETDVRTFRRFDRTNAAVMRRMHVADFESGAIAAQPAGPEGREPALVRQLRERIRLVHELRELRAAEEIANDRAESCRVDQLL